MYKIIDNEKMKTVKKYLKYKIFNEHIKYITDEGNGNIKLYLSGKLDKCAYDIGDLNEKMIDIDVQEKNIYYVQGYYL